MKRIILIAIIICQYAGFSQNVGIGTNNPLSKLHVAGTIRSDTLIYLGPGVRTLFATPNGRIYDSLVAAANWQINGNSNITAAQFLGTTNANDVIFKTNNIERARILANGNTGIGIINPAVPLEVNNRARVSSSNPLIELNGTFAAVPSLASFAIRSAGEVVLRSNSTNVAIPDWEIKYGSGTYAYLNDAFYVSRRAVPTATATNYFMMINNTGNMGVGTTTPGNRLELTAAAANASGLRFTNLTSASPTVAANGKALSVDANGDVVLMPSASDAWRILGNAGTTAGTNFLGTTDAQDLVFKTNNTERARILSAGNFGIGTSTPGTKLEVTAIGGDGITIRANAGTDVGDLIFRDGAGIEKGRIYTDGSAASALILSGGSTPATHVYITSTGDVGVGTVTPLTRLHVAGVHPGGGAGTGVSNDAASQAIIPAGSDGATYKNDWPAGWGGGLAVWDVVGSETFFNANLIRSDKKLKTNINDMNQDHIKRIMSLRPVTYYMKEQTPGTDGLQYGFIAQEVREIFPSIVTKAKDENSVIGMNYQALIAPTVYVVQQQQKEIETLKLQNNDLLKDVETLKKQNEEILKLLKKQ
jgi:hypothetical protein